MLFFVTNRPQHWSAGYDFSCKLTCGAGPGDQGGPRGPDSAENFGNPGPNISCQTAFSYPGLSGAPGAGLGRKSRERRAANLQPDCLQLPRFIEYFSVGVLGFGSKTTAKASNLQLWAILGRTWPQKALRSYGVRLVVPLVPDTKTLTGS